VDRAGVDQGWFLEGLLDGEAVPRRFALRSFPSQVGRTKDADIPLPSSKVSKRHAELTLDGGELWLRDLGSSNGTYLNRARIDRPVTLRSGDIVQFANMELLVGCEISDQDKFSDTSVMMTWSSKLVTGLYSRARALRLMIDAGSVAAAFQPIVALRGAPRPAFEVLGRGADSHLPESPGALFEIAEETGLARDLSRSFRRAALLAAEAVAGLPRLYTNVHPVELEDDDIIEDLSWFRQRYPELPLTVEVHESTVTDARQMRRLRARLKELDVALAYDDFGAGQARLLELADCPPDCLKFDMSLIQNLDKAPKSRQRIVETMVRLANEAGAACLAEGVETAEELELCKAMGFEFAQGYFIARPSPAQDWEQPWTWDQWCTDKDAVEG